VIVLLYSKYYYVHIPISEPELKTQISSIRIDDDDDDDDEV